LAARAAALEALAGTAVVFEEGVANEADEGGEGEFAGVAGAAVRLEEAVKGLRITLPLAEPEDGLRQGQAVQDIRRKVRRLHQRVSERIRTAAPNAAAH